MTPRGFVVRHARDAVFERGLRSFFEYRDLGIRHMEALTLNNLGYLQWLKGEGSEALERVEASLAIRRQLDEPVGTGYSLLVRARILISRVRTETRGLRAFVVGAFLVRQRRATQRFAVQLTRAFPVDGCLLRGDCSEGEQQRERQHSGFHEAPDVAVAHRVSSDAWPGRKLWLSHESSVTSRSAGRLQRRASVQ